MRRSPTTLTRYLSLGLLAALLCCEPRSSVHDACRATEDCDEGMVCINEHCREACNSDADCEGGQFCVTGFCLPDPEVTTDAATSDLLRGDAGAIDSAGHDAARADAAGVDNARADAARPDSSRPDSARADTSRPDVCPPSCAGKCAGAPDGCGGSCSANDCGGACCSTVCCPLGQVCGPSLTCCQPQSCIDLGHACGDHANACGGQVSCGGCPDGESCQAGQCVAPAVNCAPIAAASNFELCESSSSHCAGLFLDGSGCAAFCGAAGLTCTARFGGEEGCIKEPDYPIDCSEVNTHLSDWCECGVPASNPTCQPNPGAPPQGANKHFSQAVFDPRSSWVLACRDYAYTAQFAEHEACDSSYVAGSGRGTATFTFSVNRGTYDVYVEGRHTANRNPAGALVRVSSAGQTYTAYIDQRDDSGAVQLDLHGTYCLDGAVTVVMDSTVSAESDSVRSVVLDPR